MLRIEEIQRMHVCVVPFDSRLTVECRACSLKRSSFAAFVAGSLFEIEWPSNDKIRDLIKGFEGSS